MECQLYNMFMDVVSTSSSLQLHMTHSVNVCVCVSRYS